MAICNKKPVFFIRLAENMISLKNDEIIFIWSSLFLLNGTMIFHKNEIEILQNISFSRNVYILKRIIIP
jgi:hypothetical protein